MSLSLLRDETCLLRALHLDVIHTIDVASLSLSPDARCATLWLALHCTVGAGCRGESGSGQSFCFMCGTHQHQRGVANDYEPQTLVA